MKKVDLKCLVFLLFVSLSFVIKAQQISIPFSCGFEDTTEIKKYWKINAGVDGKNCLDKWMIGNLDYNEGYNSMYISCDSGQTTNYGAKPNVVIAYRPIVIPSSLDPSKTSYSVDISFDYKCVGREKFSELKFYLLPSDFVSEADLLSAANTSVLPPVLEYTALATFSGTLEWTNWSMPKPQTLFADMTFYMIFVWQNANTDTAAILPQAACIDNIQITSSGCWKPENIQTTSTCDTLWVAWEGSNEMYEFEYRPSGAPVWRGNQVMKGNEKSIVLSNIAEGSYDVRVRGICGDVKSAWVTKNNVVCFCPDRHCINYVDLDREGVTCEIGTATDPTKARPAIYPTGLGNSLAGPVDYGSNDKRSRHTVNWKQGEYDSRTGNKLRTIPEGSLASVRLGNWEVNRQAEGITYDYEVDTTNSFILLMKYAVVLEAPGHGADEDPYFKLEIIDENGNVINPVCGEFEFTPENASIKWHEIGGFVWKDWTSIGLNLAAYHGKKIQIRLVTQDCLLSAHCGYAYFTLDCVDAAIKTTSCGGTVDMEMVAPDGFVYTWYRGENREEPYSTERFISVPANDIETYYCVVDYIDVEGCEFELHTVVRPRYPHADFDYQWKPENCQNRIVFNNKSCVHTRIDNVDTPTDEKCETFYWSINGGEYESSIEHLVYDVPREGGTLNVTLRVGISDDVCQDSITIQVPVPSISDHYDTIYTTLCEGNTVLFDNKLLATAGEYVEYKKNVWGCDSVTTLCLTVVPQPDEVHIYDTICGTEVFVFNDKEIKESGEYTFMLPGAFGCDSIIILHLEKILPLGIDVIVENDFVCADAQTFDVRYDFVEGMRKPVYCSIVFDSLAQLNGFVNVDDILLDEDNRQILINLPLNCRPNHYGATLFFVDTTGLCGDVSVPIEFDVYYQSSIMESKFDNLITIVNADYNGGYSFVEYQWYKNDTLLEGETDAYLYFRNGEVFQENDCFYLVLKREDDGVVMPTCKICPGVRTNIDDVFVIENILPITLFRCNQEIEFGNISNAEVAIYTPTGQLVNTCVLTSDNSRIFAPSIPGMYFLRISIENYTKSYKIHVR